VPILNAGAGMQRTDDRIVIRMSSAQGRGRVVRVCKTAQSCSRSRWLDPGGRGRRRHRASAERGRQEDRGRQPAASCSRASRFSREAPPGTAPDERTSKEAATSECG